MSRSSVRKTPGKAKRVTMADIARKVGVAPQVVSTVLNGGKGTASARPEIRKQIQKVAENMGYRPFMAGQALRKGSFQSVGILTGSPEDFLMSQATLNGIVEQLAREDYSATLVHAPSATTSGLLENRLITSHLADGLLIPLVRPPSTRLKNELEALPVPVVWLNRGGRENSLRMNESAAAGELVRVLAKRDPEGILFVDYSGAGKEEHTRDRILGARKEARKLGRSFNTLLKSVPRNQRAEEVSRWLESVKPPLHLIVNSLSAAQVILQVAVRRGWNIPEDLSLTTFDQGNAHTANDPVITCAVRPDYIFGIEAGNMILNRIQNPGTPIPGVQIDFKLVRGGTT